MPAFKAGKRAQGRGRPAPRPDGVRRPSPVAAARASRAPGRLDRGQPATPIRRIVLPLSACAMRVGLCAGNSIRQKPSRSSIAPDGRRGPPAVRASARRPGRLASRRPSCRCSTQTLAHRRGGGLLRRFAGSARLACLCLTSSRPVVLSLPQAHTARAATRAGSWRSNSGASDRSGGRGTVARLELGPDLRAIVGGMARELLDEARQPQAPRVDGRCCAT